VEQEPQAILNVPLSSLTTDQLKKKKKSPKQAVG
jgi:hypothetical protein